MVVSTMETGKMAKRKDMASIPIQMVVDTKASASMARKRGKEHTFGLMDVSMKGTGRMGRNTESDFTRKPLE